MTKRLRHERSDPEARGDGRRPSRGLALTLAVACLLAAACVEIPPEIAESEYTNEDVIIFALDPPAVYLSPGDSYSVQMTATSRLDARLFWDLAYVNPDPDAPRVRPNDAVIDLDSNVGDQRAWLRVETSETTEAGAYPIEVEVGHTILGDPLVRTFYIVVLPGDMAEQSEEIVAVAGGLAHTLALDVNGDVWAWGSNTHGQLGDGSFVNRPIPVRTLDLPRPAVAIAAGARHSLALLDDGTVVGWGDNEQRQADPRSRVTAEDDRRVRPRRLDGVEDIVAIAAGSEHSLALGANGNVFAFGSNARRALATERDDLEENIVDLVVVDVVDVAAGDDFSLVLAADGSVWGWGAARDGQIGADIGNADRERPVEIGFTPDVDAIGVGGRHTLMVLDDGNVGSLGSNFHGQLGDGSRSSPIAQPYRPPFLLSVEATDGGLIHSLALQSNRQVYAWGNNRFGQVSDSGILTQDAQGRIDQLVPVRVASLPPSAGIAAGGRHSLSIDDFCGHLFAWGDDASGQLGVGNYEPRGEFRPEPRPAIGLGEIALPSGCPVTLSIVLRGSGRVWAAGTSIQESTCEESPCAASLALDTVVDLAASPDPGHEFIAWGGQCDSETSDTTIVMDRGRNCVAHFNAFPIPDIAALAPVPIVAFSAWTRFDVSRSRDPDGEIVRYEWDFDDDGEIDATGADAEFQTSRLGEHLIRLIVTDDQGATAETTTIVTVVDEPVATIVQSPEGLRVGEEGRFVASQRGSYVRYQWDFDDDGVFDAEGPVVTHVFESPGTRTIRLLVTGDRGAQDDETVQVEVLPAAGEVTLTVVPRGGGNGTVLNATESLVCNLFGNTSEPSPCSLTVPAGTTETLHAFAIEGSVFSHWEVGGCDAEVPGDPNPDCVITLNEDREVDLYLE